MSNKAMARPRFPKAHLASRESGQALIIAVLVLFAVATLAALLAAIVGSQLAQVTRASDVVELNSIAEAGLSFANEQLTYSVEGADWRPGRRLAGGRIVNQPYPCGRGVVRIDVSFGPRPDRLQSRFMRIVATAYFPDNPFLRHTILGLKSVLLTDYARLVTDRFETNEPVDLGVTGVELAGQARQALATAGAGGVVASPYIFDIEGPVRSNTDVIWHGPSRVSLWNSDSAAPASGGETWRDLGILRDDRIEIAGRLRRDPFVPLTETFQLLVNGVTRITNIYRTVGEERTLRYSGCPDTGPDGNPVPNSERLLDGDYAVPRVQPPLIDAVQPDLQTNRYLALTRDSGVWKPASEGGYYNTGAFGWGWMHGGGIYVDNADDIQYKHDLDLLRMNWMRSVGHHHLAAPAGDIRAGESPDLVPPTGPADWWDQTGRYYNPPGVRIILHGDRYCPYVEIIRDDAKTSGDATYYWVDPDRNPIIGSYLPRDPVTGETPCSPAGRSTGLSVDGPRAIFPFPPNGVIYCEGNVRVDGIMPIVRGTPKTYFDPEFDAQAGRNRRFDLTIVSGGTIYIEGDLLTPGPAGARLTHPDNRVGVLDTMREDMLYGSRVALLARDSVCVNTTAFFPRPRDLTRVVQQDDDKYAYNDLQPVRRAPGHTPYWWFQGTPMDDAECIVAYPDPDQIPEVPTIPANTVLTYHNIRVRNSALRAELADLRLILGHSAWYSTIDSVTNEPNALPSMPPGPADPSTDEPAVHVAVAINGVDYIWDHASTRYSFYRQDKTPAPDPAGADESGHWVVDTDLDALADDDYLELLPNSAADGFNGIQWMRVQGANPNDPEAEPLSYLHGDDTITITPIINPIRRMHVDQASGELVVDGWQENAAPQNFAYLLGPVAIAPPNPVYSGDAWQMVDPLPVQIQAMIYAQNGSWFIIPGPWFNDDPTGPEATESDSPAYHEPLNIRISVYGAITENRPAPIGDVADWTSKWAGPYVNGGGFLKYEYDPLLRLPRANADGTTWVRFPGLCLTPDLMVWGERVSAATGG